LQVLPGFGAAAGGAAPAIQAFAGRSDDPFLRLEAAEALLRLGDAAGFALVGAVLGDEPPLLVEQKAGQLLREMTASDFGVGRSREDDAREAALQRFAAWLDGKGKTVRWRPELRRFD
jgi:HEAT repeat protein